MTTPRRVLRMPRMIKCSLIGVAAMGFAPLTAGTAQAATTGGCTPSTLPLTQAFLGWGDTNMYQSLLGESNDSFAGTGWKLSGGASIVTTTLANGTTSQVLNLPSGSLAISPTVCIDSAYPTARTMIRDVVGGEGVQFYINYPGTNGFKNTGQVHGNGTSWTLSDNANLQTNNMVGWQEAQFEFVPGGQTSDFQIYNFFLDPYCRG